MEKQRAYGILPYKIENGKIKILLCKSVKSLNKWGCLKGMQQGSESSKMCAKREFFEESSISVGIHLLEEFFLQRNKNKDIGIWLVNSEKLDGFDEYFIGDRLKDDCLSWENSKVKFFDIEKLPSIKKKQKYLIDKIKDFLQNKNQFH